MKFARMMLGLACYIVGMRVAGDGHLGAVWFGFIAGLLWARVAS